MIFEKIKQFTLTIFCSMDIFHGILLSTTLKKPKCAHLKPGFVLLFLGLLKDSSSESWALLSSLQLRLQSSPASHFLFVGIIFCREFVNSSIAYVQNCHQCFSRKLLDVLCPVVLSFQKIWGARTNATQTRVWVCFFQLSEENFIFFPTKRDIADDSNITHVILPS